MMPRSPAPATVVPICRRVCAGQLHGDGEPLQRRRMTTFVQLALTSSNPSRAVTDRLRGWPWPLTSPGSSAPPAGAPGSDLLLPDAQRLAFGGEDRARFRVARELARRKGWRGAAVAEQRQADRDGHADRGAAGGLGQGRARWCG